MLMAGFLYGEGFKIMLAHECKMQPPYWLKEDKLFIKEK